MADDASNRKTCQIDTHACAAFILEQERLRGNGGTLVIERERAGGQSRYMLPHELPDPARAAVDNLLDDFDESTRRNVFPVIMRDEKQNNLFVIRRERALELLEEAGLPVRASEKNTFDHLS